eukprot:SAG11_NODE_6144_length_1378_cov_1.407349_2_plen_130_part_00
MSVARAGATAEDVARAAELHAAATARAPRAKPAVTETLAKELGHVAEQTVNGANSVYRGTAPAGYRQPPPVEVVSKPSAAPNAKSILDAEGPEAMAQWVKAQPHTMVMDTTMRDAHQSLFATRVRSFCI